MLMRVVMLIFGRLSLTVVNLMLRLLFVLVLNGLVLVCGLVFDLCCWIGRWWLCRVFLWLSIDRMIFGRGIRRCCRLTLILLCVVLLSA